MFFLRLTINEYVVKEDDHEFPYILPKNVVHAPLEGSRRVSEAKWHHFPLIVSIVGPKGSSLYVLGIDLDLIIPTHEVYLREDRCPMKLIYQIIGPR